MSARFTLTLFWFRIEPVLGLAYTHLETIAPLGQSHIYSIPT